MPFQVVSSTNRVEHQNCTRLIEGTMNASLVWHFKLSSELTFVSLTLELNGSPIASETVVFTHFRDKYAVNSIQSSGIIITLVIFEVTAALNGIFSCHVFAREQAQLTWKSHVKVDVIAPPSNIVTLSSQIIIPPSELTLNCSADGKPDPNITWTRGGTVVTMPLNITGEKDGGNYSCTADNGVGKPLTKDVFVDVQFSPKVILAQKVFVGREQNASLNCEVKGNPKPTISWSPCDEGNLLCNEQYLNISKVQSPRANYTCTARNYLGIDSAITVLVIGGKNIYLRLSVSGECDKNVSVWEALVKEISRVFANTTQNYSGAELLMVRCGSLIFDVVFKFSTVFAEDETFNIIQNAIVDGKLGELSMNVSYIIGIPRFPRTTVTAPTSITSKSYDQSSSNLIVTGVSIGIGVLIAVVVGLVILWVLIRRNSRKENTKGDYEMSPLR
ncbi:PREDICTED: interference hedgehog-like isoform X2 [Acropora digitifera]|nr:PREDICTED: interference hedgehog-like isoform X2 [Acropora digitifera]